MNGILLATWAGTISLAKKLLESEPLASSPHKKIVTVNEIESVQDYETYDWLQNNFETYPIEGNRWEMGAIQAALVFSKLDEFILIQDTLEIKDMAPFDAMLATEGHSIAYGKTWECYLGKYREAVLRNIMLPTVLTKLDAVYWEFMFPAVYGAASELIEGHKYFVVNPEWGNDNPKNYFEEAFGRNNLVLHDDYIVKRKSADWSLKNNIKAFVVEHTE